MGVPQGKVREKEKKIAINSKENPKLFLQYVNSQLKPPEDPGDKILWSPLDWLLPPKMKPSYQDIKLLGTKLDTKKI